MTVGAPTVPPPQRSLAPATAGAPAPVTPAPHKSRLRTWLDGTPGRLRVLTVLVVVVTLGFGLLGWQSFRATSQALQRADANTAQLLRVQAIAIDLAKADATAATSFLVGGAEPPAQRVAYLATLDDATAQISRAASAQKADADALAALNTIVARYAGLVEQARANNRQNLQVGAQYLRDASDLLRSQAQPILKNLADANNARVTTEINAAESSALLLDIVGGLAVVVIAAGLVWLAMRTKRYVNVGLAVSLVVVLATVVVSAIALGGVSSQVKQVRDGALARTIALGAARVAAYDARSNESLTLISRGSGQAFEKAWQADSAAVLKADPDLASTWDEYVKAHQAIRALDDGGDWQGAVYAATSAQKASTTTFTQFADTTAKALAAQSASASQGLKTSHSWLPYAAWLALLAGLFAALAGWRGVGQRLEEYR